MVAARHLELISTRFKLENLVSQLLQECIYQSMMVRFHMRREFLGTVLKYSPPGERLTRTALQPLLRPKAPSLLGPETFLSSQRLLSRERERPLEMESEEPDHEAWAAWQAAEEARRERTINLLKRFFCCHPRKFGPKRPGGDTYSCCCRLGPGGCPGRDGCIRLPAPAAAPGAPV